MPLDDTTKPSEAECIARIESGALTLDKLPLPSRTHSVCVAAVKKNSSQIQHVPKNLKLETYCTIVKENPLFLYAYSFPKEFSTEFIQTVYLEAISRDSKVLVDLPKALQTEDFYFAAIQRNPSALRRVPGHLRTEKLCIKAIELTDGEALSAVPNTLKAACIEAIGVNTLLTRNFRALRYFPTASFQSEIQEFRNPKHHAMVFFVDGSAKGFGDLLFALKSVAALDKHLRERNYPHPLYLVTHSEGKKRIQTLRGDVEFGVQILSIEEYQQKNLILDCFIEGPIFYMSSPPHVGDPFEKAYYDFYLTAKTHSILISEYSRPHILPTSNWIAHNYPVTAISGGLPKNRGILLTEELIEVARKKEAQDFSFRGAYWHEIGSKHAKVLRGKLLVSEYHQLNELSFAYHNSGNARYNYYAESSIQHFLQVHLLFTQNSSKNQDIVSINSSSDINTVKAELQTLVELIKKNGYQRICLIDLDSNQETILYNGNTGRKPAKTYRVLFSKGLTHRQMIAMQALSGDLTSTTGDQSWGEALSAGKIIDYESGYHKWVLAEDFISSLYTVTQNPKVKQLATQLLKLNLTTATDEQRAELLSLLSDEDTLKAYKEGCRVLAEKCNLMDAICEEVDQVLSKLKFEPGPRDIKEENKPSPHEEMQLAATQLMDSFKEKHKGADDQSLLEALDAALQSYIDTASEYLEKTAQSKHSTTELEKTLLEKERRVLEKTIPLAKYNESYGESVYRSLRLFFHTIGLYMSERIPYISSGTTPGRAGFFANASHPKTFSENSNQAFVEILKEDLSDIKSLNQFFLKPSPRPSSDESKTPKKS